MKHLNLTFLCLFLYLLPQSVFSQTPNLLVSYTNPDGLFVCGSDTLTIQIQNSGDAMEAGALLSLNLPAGLAYVAGSVSGAGQQNISNLASPVYTLPAIITNGSVQIRLLVSADCNAADLLDAGGLFFATISVNGQNSNASVTTTSIPVETGLLLIESVAPAYLEGERCDTLFRTICVENTRLGKIGNLHFEDSHQPGIDISVTGATSQANGPQLFQANFPSSLFTGIGNHDEWLDLGESVCFTEKIIITDCGTPQHLLSSQLRVGWGCGPEVCRYDSVIANILIKPSTKIPELVFSTIKNKITDNCGQTGAQMGLKIRNTGRSDATNLSIKFAIPLLVESSSLAPGSFKLVNSSGVVTPITPNLVTANPSFLCNPTTSMSVIITVPLIQTADSVQVLFDLLSCGSPCEQLDGQVYVEYFYRKDCPVNGFVSDTLLFSTNSGSRINASLNMGIGQCLEDGQSYPATYKVNSQRLTEADGFLHVEFTLPHGISLDPSCNTTLAGATPVSVETTPNPFGIGTLVHWIYALPLPSTGMQMDLCLHFECDSNLICSPATPVEEGVYTAYLVDCIPCISGIQQRTYWTPTETTPADCGIGTCSTNNLILDNCNGGEPPFPDDGVPGARLLWKFETKRLNRGYQDSNDDRVADNNQTAPESEVRLDRYLSGDTMQVFYCAIVDTGFLNALPRNIYHESLRSDVGGAENNDMVPLDQLKEYFCDAMKFRFLRDSMRIHYATGEQVALAVSDFNFVNDKNLANILLPNNFPNSELDVLSSQRHAFSISFAVLFAQGLIPKPTLTVGDTVQFFTDFKLGMNFNYPAPMSLDPSLVGFRTAINHLGTPFAWKAYPSQKMQYSGFQLKTTPNTFSIKPCEPSIEVKKFKYSLRIARENLFPREVRPLGQITDYQTTVPAGTTVSSINMDYLALQDSVPWIQNLPLPFIETPGYLNVDYSPAFSLPIDEGFSLRSTTIFNANCTLSQPDTSQQRITTTFEGCVNSDTMTVTSKIRNAIGYFTNHPRLELLSDDSILNAASRDFEMSFSLKNPFVIAAQYPWVTVQSPSGLSSNFKLFRMPQNQAVNQQNGLFNVAAVNGFATNQFKLTGTATNCSTDTLLIIYGWDCAPVSSLSQAGCYRDTYYLRVNLLKPELELDILNEPTPIDLCDTTGYYEFEVFNAKLGYAYDVYGSVKLPSGMRVAAGTSQLFYPPVGAWVNINDPEELSGNVSRWNVSENQAQIGANGLAGVQSAPANTVRIRFRAIAECGFVANTPIIYGTYGKEACGRSTNILNKPGDPINVIGLNPTYGVVVSLAPVGAQEPICGLEQEFTANLNLLGQPGAGDSVFVVLPPGASWVSGAYQPGPNAPAGPPVLTADGFSLPLPALPGGGSFQFNFKVVYGPGAGCGDQTLLVQSRIHAEAFCETLGAPCDVYVATGEYALNLNIQHPELTTNNAFATVENGQMTVTTTVQNIGSYQVQSATAQVWYDADGDQLLSAADVLLQTMNSASILNPGSAGTLSGAFTDNPAYRCNLFLVLPADENCACEAVMIPINVFEILYDTLNYCVLETIQVGIPEQPGADYQWINTGNGIACVTCASTEFTPDNNTQAGVPIELTLQETDGNCMTTHQYLVNFGSIATISLNNAVICEGAAATLQANPAGQQYLWQGPGISDPQMQNQVVAPVASADYSLTITFANGCTATAVASISVLPADSTLRPVIEACEGSLITVFGEEIQAVNEVFSLTLTKLNGCDSVLLQPVVVKPQPLTEASVVFCEGTTLMLFDTMLQVSGQVCRTFTAANGCDSTHCISASAIPGPDLPAQDTLFTAFGESIDLGGFPGFQSYTWTPTPNPACNNCPGITVTPDSAGYFEYTLTVEDPNGCTDMVTWRVVVSPPCDPNNVDIPNAFTPNGDGANDVFRPVMTETGELIGRLVVYDRWGEKVYENTGNVFWDGTIDGKPAPSDVYVYLIEIECTFGKLVKPGEVTLLR